MYLNPPQPLGWSSRAIALWGGRGHRRPRGGEPSGSDVGAEGLSSTGVCLAQAGSGQRHGDQKPPSPLALVRVQGVKPAAQQRAQCHCLPARPGPTTRGAFTWPPPSPSYPHPLLPLHFGGAGDRVQRERLGVPPWRGASPRTASRPCCLTTISACTLYPNELK